MTKKLDRYFLSCRDYTVSGKEFDLYWNEERDILQTFPVPSSSELPGYYKSQDYISHTDSSKTLIDKIYQAVKSKMLQKKLDLISSFSSGKTLLDIGAGTGDFLALAKQNYWRINGIEPNTNARKLALDKGVNLSANKNTLEPEKYDAITLWHVLEHIPNLEEEIESLKSLLNIDGTLFIAVPNFKSYDARHYKKYWAAYDVPRHIWHFSKEGIERLFSQHNLKLVKTKPLVYDSFYVSLLSEKYKGGNFKFIKAFLTGLKSNILARRSKEYSSIIYIFKQA
ncbi:class I SAM-dependent methyltransferase [Mesonia aquimarina]|uniref:class I SAM-dependent methyltransferase n=1 Tax=Mesonia aquimarina TaxID=1504967 RepID=UPI000EF5D012|nr:class I SAM-dependent methyltransferase [Mesonia aquimarina]